MATVGKPIDLQTAFPFKKKDAGLEAIIDSAMRADGLGFKSPTQLTTGLRINPSYPKGGVWPDPPLRIFAIIFEPLKI